MMETTTQAFIGAVKAGDRAGVLALLAANPALADARAATGESAILLGIYYNQPEIVRILLDNGAQLTIFEAAAVGGRKGIAELLDQHADLVNAVAPDGFTPLGLAAFFGHGDLVDLLLSRGADVNQASQNAQRVMPLHSAVASQRLAIAEVLLAHGAQVNATQADDFTPLHGAAQNGQLEMVKLLLDNGADVDFKRPNGQTALSIALENGHADVAALLQSHGAAG